MFFFSFSSFFGFIPPTTPLHFPSPPKVDKFVADALNDKKFDDDNAKTAGDGKIISTRSQAAKVLKDQQIEVKDLREMEASVLMNMGLSFGAASTLLQAAQANPKIVPGKSDLKIPIRHMFMLKTLSEDENGKLWLIGTIVQTQFGCDQGFEFRVNDAVVTAGMFHERRSTHYRNIGCRRTYNVRLPLDKEMQYVYNHF